jgi:hypothetical protein
MARTAAQARHYLVFGGAIYLVLFLYGLIVGQESGQLRAREYCRRRPASHTRDRDGRARSRAHAGSYGGRRRHQLRTPVDVTTSIARKTTPPTTRRFDPGRHRLVRDRGGHRYTFGTLRLRAGKQARMGVGEEDRLPRVRSKLHDAVSGRVAKGRNETHAGHELNLPLGQRRQGRRARAAAEQHVPVRNLGA